MYEVNRSLFALVPLEPFWEWLQSLSDVDLSDITLFDLQQDVNSYLLPPCEDANDVWTQIDALCETVFAQELADWCEDESLWPDLTPEVFQEWFDIQISTVVTDLAPQELFRESFKPMSLN
ncbi:hypothetical protein [Stenoxybacter acetivorans]|uniref:hypothetical protein n=1 Tax=Stenoxybacter acetivorans TaxID=422441 RepID=UPI00055E6F76|nr:hypothetical protein [Stenoxybacter acetivorans]